MSWHWSAAMAFALASCGGAGRAVPAEVEIDWPDAATPGAAPAPGQGADVVDAGVTTPSDSMPEANDAAGTPSH